MHTLVGVVGALHHVGHGSGPIPRALPHGTDHMALAVVVQSHVKLGFRRPVSRYQAV
ncbi:Uncharacterised protein [Mycobacterium tuberculosis]|nr:Uncharacterised protein [Mycobacterium tuberculosis]